MNSPLVPIERKDLVRLFYKVLSSDTSEIDPVMDEMMGVVKQLSFRAEEEERIRLAVYEALANAILHGNENDPEKEVAIGCFFDSGNSKDLVIVIRDEGEGFDPAGIPSPLSGEGLYASHGRGIHLMRQLVDEVTYFDAGREVELRKRSRQ